MIETEKLVGDIKKEIAIGIDKCRACDSPAIHDVFDLGDIRVARFSEEKSDLCAPLEFCWCEDCHYLQLRHNIDTNVVFYPDYGYESGINPIMVKELRGIVEDIENIIELEDGDKWLDIASNDGTLLLQTNGNIHRVGFDPSKGVAVKGADKLIKKFGVDKTSIYINYFGKGIWARGFGKEKAKVITAVAVFYSVQNPQIFLQDVKSVLDPNGIFVVQQNYTPEMISQNAFCNVVHEHVTYPTLSSFKTLLERQGLKVLDVKKSSINGGSFRVFIGHNDTQIAIDGGEDRVHEMLMEEESAGYLTIEAYQNFGHSIKEKGELVRGYLQKGKDEGKKIYGLAASTRGNTRLQVWGLGPEVISGIAEKNPRKIGGETLGIPIVSDEEALNNADILFVSIWFYGDNLIEAYKPFLERGGKMLFPSSDSGEPFLVEMRGGKVFKVHLSDAS